jgi:hypothetical protein
VRQRQGSNWNRDEITPIKNGLRRRIKGFKKLCKYAGDFWSDYSIVNCWSGELTEEFLSLDPLPTIKDLERVADFILYGIVGGVYMLWIF